MNLAISDNPSAVKRIVQGVLSGENKTLIANDLGINPSTVHNTLKKPKVKAIIEKAYDDIASLAPYVFKTYNRELTTEPQDLDDRKLQVAVAKEVSGITGISPIRDSRSSIFLTNIFAPTQINLHPMVEGMLERLGTKLASNALPSGSPDYTDADLIDD